MGWRDSHLHRFHIHGNDYGVAHEGGINVRRRPREDPSRRLRIPASRALPVRIRLLRYVGPRCAAREGFAMELRDDDEFEPEYDCPLLRPELSAFSRLDEHMAQEHTALRRRQCGKQPRKTSIIGVDHSHQLFRPSLELLRPVDRHRSLLTKGRDRVRALRRGKRKQTTLRKSCDSHVEDIELDRQIDRGGPFCQACDQSDLLALRRHVYLQTIFLREREEQLERAARRMPFSSINVAPPYARGS